VTRPALILNPAKVDADQLSLTVGRHCRERGLPPPIVLTTTEQDPGTGMAEQALSRHADLVLVAGGDGTVRAVAQGLSGTDTALAVLPSGTGNLLVRNLDLPTDVDEAIRQAFDGPRRRIDLGVLHRPAPTRPGSGPIAGEAQTGPEPTMFAVMAGIGLDAAMMHSTPEGLKSAVGWPAYLVGLIRALRHSTMIVELSVDGGPPIRQRAQMVLIGNVGRLQAGLELLPDAVPDDGRLDLCVLAPRGLSGWAKAAVATISGKPPRRRGEPVQVRPVGRVSMRSRRARPCQLDGDLVDPAAGFTIEVLPGALLICGGPDPIKPKENEQ
jgi:diacylglycerol kinase (ATP)